MPDAKILVVDDEPANLQKLRRTLIHRYDVLAATNGLEAMDLVAHETGIDVIIADQRMPDMTGVEFLRRTLEPLPDAVRIILTGYTDVDALMEAINTCKVFRYLVKPWDPPDLLMAVERGLEAQRLAVENARYRKELIRRERLARELEIATEIQRYILPPRCPVLDGYEMAVEYHPAREVGGDLYDFELDAAAGMCHIVIGDVSGKSIPAALYGAVFSGQLRAVLREGVSPARNLQRLNVNLISHYRAENFIGVAHLRLSKPDGACTLANGGMPYPWIMRGGVLSRLNAGGVPLGLVEEAEYEELQFELAKGDMLILASDGATDAINPAGEIYDPERFEASISRHANEGIQQFARSLYGDLQNFAGSRELVDDVTLIILKRLP